MDFDNDELAVSKSPGRQDFDLMEVFPQRRLPRRAAYEMVKKIRILIADDTEKIWAKFAEADFCNGVGMADLGQKSPESLGTPPRRQKLYIVSVFRSKRVEPLAELRKYPERDPTAKTL
jgi:hypothetical protein